jgi:hypothetical protein
MRLMKLGWVGAAVLGSLVAIQPVAQAQEKKDEKPAAPAAPAVPASTPQIRAARVEARLKSLDRMLMLTDEQKTKIRPILEEEVQKFEEMRQDKATTTQDRMKKLTEIREVSQTKITPILTADQQAKYARLQPGGQRKVEIAPTGPPK